MITGVKSVTEGRPPFSPPPFSPFSFSPLPLVVSSIDYFEGVLSRREGREGGRREEEGENEYRKGVVFRCGQRASSHESQKIPGCDS